MTKEDIIINILVNKLSYAYCDNCGSTDCECCHRKDQSWSLSRHTAQYLANQILNSLNITN